jgi:hypothetical protein
VIGAEEGRKEGRKRNEREFIEEKKKKIQSGYRLVK